MHSIEFACLNTVYYEQVTYSLAAKVFQTSLPLCKETFFFAAMEDHPVSRLVSYLEKVATWCNILHLTLSRSIQMIYKRILFKVFNIITKDLVVEIFRYDPCILTVWSYPLTQILHSSPRIRHNNEHKYGKSIVLLFFFFYVFQIVAGYQKLMTESSRMPLFDLRKLSASLPVPPVKDPTIKVLVLGANDDFIVVMCIAFTHVAFPIGYLFVLFE